MEELRKCPFCGGKPHITLYKYSFDKLYFLKHTCKKQPLLHIHGGAFNTRAEAITAWNRRATQNIGKKECCEQGEEQ